MLILDLIIIFCLASLSATAGYILADSLPARFVRAHRAIEIINRAIS